MRKLSFFILIFFLALASSHTWSETTLKLSGPPWPPFLYQEQPESGLSTEIVIQALEKAGYKTQVSIKPWRRALAEAKGGRIDVLIGLWHNEERAKSFAYSSPYYFNKIHLVSLKEKTPQFTTLQDLGDQRIGVRQGASFGSEFDEANYLNKIFVPSANNMLQMLIRGRLDLGVGDHLILKGIIAEHQSLTDHVTFLEPALAVLPLHMAVVRSLPNYQKIVDDFNRSLETMKKSGELSGIYRKYGVKNW